MCSVFLIKPQCQKTVVFTAVHQLTHRTSRLANEISERCGDIEYIGVVKFYNDGVAWLRRSVFSRNVRLSHLLMRVSCENIVFTTKGRMDNMSREHALT